MTYMIGLLFGLFLFTIYFKSNSLEQNECKLTCITSLPFIGRSDSTNKSCEKWKSTSLNTYFPSGSMSILNLLLLNQFYCVKGEGESRPWCLKISTQQIFYCNEFKCGINNPNRCFQKERYFITSMTFSVQIKPLPDKFGYFSYLFDLKEIKCIMIIMKLCKLCTGIRDNQFEVCKFNRKYNTDKTSISYKNLHQNRNYAFAVFLYTSDIKRQLVHWHIFTTDIAEPEKPKNVKFITGMTFIDIMWEKAEETHEYGPTVYFQVDVSTNRKILYKKKIHKKIDERFYLFLKYLQPCQKYEFSLKAVNKVGSSKPYIATKYTKLIDLSNVTRVRVNSGYSTEKYVTWSYEAKSICGSMKYKIMYKIKGDHNSLKFKFTKTLNYFLTDLKVNKIYLVRVAITVETEAKIIEHGTSKWIDFYTGNEIIRLISHDGPIYRDDTIYFSWIISKTDKGNIYMYIVQFRGTKSCKFLQSLICLDCQQPNVESSLPASVQKNLSKTLGCDTVLKPLNFSYFKSNFEVSIKVKGRLPKGGLHLFAVNYNGINLLYNTTTFSSDNKSVTFVVWTCIIGLIIYIVVGLLVLYYLRSGLKTHPVKDKKNQPTGICKITYQDGTLPFISNISTDEMSSMNEETLEKTGESKLPKQSVIKKKIRKKPEIRT